MRKLALALLMVFVMSATVFAAGDWTAVRTDQAPVIDCEFDDVWSKAVEYVIDESIVDKGGTRIAREVNPGKLAAGYFYLLWDDENLYLYAKIVDDDIRFSRRDGQPLNGHTDAIQLCFEPMARRLTNNMFLYILDFCLSVDGEPINFEHFKFNSPVRDIAMAGKITDEGWEFEAAIPWTIWGRMEEVKVGAEYPFGIIILDSGEGSGNVWDLLMDFGAGENLVGSPSAYNSLVLVE